VMEDLRAISDAWLDEHSAAEKGFSLGAFTEDYIRRCPRPCERTRASRQRRM